MCVATRISRPRAPSRLLVLRCRSLPRRPRLRVNNLLLFVIFSIFLLFLSPFLPCIFVSRRGFSRPTPRRSAHLPSPERSWCLLTGFSPPLRFPRRYASFSAMTVGTNGLTCGLNWQYTVDDIGYAVMITLRMDSLSSPHEAVMITAHLDSLPSPHFYGLGPPRPGGSRGQNVGRAPRSPNELPR